MPLRFLFREGLFFYLAVNNQKDVTVMVLLFLFWALHSGADRYYLKKSAGLHSDGRDIFYYLKLKNAVHLMSFYLCLYSLKLVLLVFSFLPFICTLLIAGSFSNADSVSLAVFKITIVLCAALFIHGLIFFIRLNSFLFMARYCFVTGRFKKIKNLFAFSFLYRYPPSA